MSDEVNHDAAESMEYPDDPLTKALRSMSFQEAVDSLGIDALKNAILDKFTIFEQGRINIESQLNSLRERVAKENSDIVQRVDKLITLMTNNAVFIRQMIDLLDNYGEKLSKFEKDSIQHRMEYLAIVEKMNTMAKNFVQVENNQREIVEEVEILKQRQDDDDKFKWKMATVLGLISVIVGWLCVGDNLKKLVIALQQALFGS